MSTQIDYLTPNVQLSKHISMYITPYGFSSYTYIFMNIVSKTDAMNLRQKPGDSRGGCGGENQEG